MSFQLYYTAEAQRQRARLEGSLALGKRWRAVRKALALMEVNLRHPALQTHKHHGLTLEFGSEVFESYAENRTPAAYRVFWVYGPGQGRLTVLAITAHP